MRAKVEEQQRACELRADGWSLRRIANELDVALSSVSTWVRDVDLPLEQRMARAPRRLPHDAVALRKVPLARSESDFRQCGKCRRYSPNGNFGKHPQNGRQWWCKQCFCSYFKARGQLHRDQVRAAQLERRIQCAAVILDRRQAGCMDCGESDPLLLDFDHVGTKRWNVSEMAWRTASPRKVLAEMEQCEVVCGNCHRRRTLHQLDSWRVRGKSLLSMPLANGERRNLLHIEKLLTETPCVDCGNSDPEVLEFDHVRGKTAHVFQLARRGVSLTRLQQEIERCEVRCVNCHRRRTSAVKRA